MAAVALAELSDMEKSELVCTYFKTAFFLSYAVCALHGAGQEVSADAMNKLIKASGCSVEAYWPTLYAQMIKGKKLGDMLKLGGGGGAAAAPAAAGAAAAGGAAAPAAAAVVEEEEDDMEFDLFD